MGLSINLSIQASDYMEELNVFETKYFDFDLRDYPS